jgi:hypothetical protein
MDAYGQVGTEFAVNQSVATCASSTCLAVSSAPFISFTNNAMPIIEVSCAKEITCGKHAKVSMDDE